MTPPLPKVENPKTIEDNIKNAWIQYASDKDFLAAEKSFRQALAIDPKAVDAIYGLGLVLKSQGRRQEAVNAFQEIINFIEGDVLQDKVRAAMLRRLSLGHINQLNTGDWNLEKEIWRRIDET